MAIRDALRGTAHTLTIVAGFVAWGFGMVWLTGCSVEIKETRADRWVCPDSRPQWVLDCVEAGTPDGLNTTDEPHYRMVSHCKDASTVTCEQRCFKRMMRHEPVDRPEPLEDWQPCAE